MFAGVRCGLGLRGSILGRLHRAVAMFAAHELIAFGEGFPEGAWEPTPANLHFALRHHRRFFPGRHNRTLMPSDEMSAYLLLQTEPKRFGVLFEAGGGHRGSGDEKSASCQYGLNSSAESPISVCPAKGTTGFPGGGIGAFMAGLGRINLAGMRCMDSGADFITQAADLVQEGVQGASPGVL